MFFFTKLLILISCLIKDTKLVKIIEQVCETTVPLLIFMQYIFFG